MNTLVPNHDFIRLWRDGSTSRLEPNGADPYDSLIMHKDHADSVYHRWAASDSDLSYFEYAKALADGRDPDKNHYAPTPEDQAIFAGFWTRSDTPPIAMLEGDHRDADIMAFLGECTEAFGGHISVDDLNRVEEMGYVYWADRCADNYEFDPIHLT